jgi:hypothetical protein
MRRRAILATRASDQARAARAAAARARPRAQRSALPHDRIYEHYVLRERRSDAARALDEDRSSFGVVRAENVSEAGTDALIDAEGRREGGIPGTAGLHRATEHVLGSLADDVYLGLARVHVGARPVGTTERSDELAVAKEERATRLSGWELRHCDHRLAAAEGKACDRELPRHRGRETHGIVQRLRGLPYTFIRVPPLPNQGASNAGK